MPTHELRTNVYEIGAAEDVTATATPSVQSTVLGTTFGTNGGGVITRIVADGNLRFAVGTNPTVTSTTGTRLPDGAGEVIMIGATERIAVVAETGTVTMNITHLL